MGLILKGHGRDSVEEEGIGSAKLEGRKLLLL